MVRALASHRCGPGSITRAGVICGLSSSCWFSTLHRKVFSGNSGFPSHQKPKFDLIVLIVNFSYSVPNWCSSARTTRHLIKVPFLTKNDLTKHFGNIIEDLFITKSFAEYFWPNVTERALCTASKPLWFQIELLCLGKKNLLFGATLFKSRSYKDT